MDKRDEYMLKIRELVKEHGFAVQFVGGDESGPAFVYTVGLTDRYQHPELVMVGIHPQTAHSVLGGMARSIKNGDARFDEDGFSDKVLRDFPAYLGKLDEQACDRLNVANAFHDGLVEAFQVVIPDADKKFPWEGDCNPEYKEMQQLMFERVIN